MTTEVQTLSPLEAQEKMDSRHQPALLIDVRTPAEFADYHVKGSRSVPLEQLNAEQLQRFTHQNGEQNTSVLLLCASGYRAEQAAIRLQQQEVNNVYVVSGGTAAWRDARLPIVRASRLPSLERQTQIALGAVLLLVLIKGSLIHPLFYALIGFLAVGLITAGITAKCQLTALLARMPWNQQPPSSPA